VRRALEDFEIDFGNSWMVGDRYSDVVLAHNAGVRSCFVMTGYGRGEWEYQRSAWKHRPDMVAENLLEAVRKIVTSDW
jgi:D-glycero-D-manno-heptose 1,7-bisphosphate phosphatase